MPEWIVEAALPVRSPRRLMVAYAIETAVCPCRDRALDERVGIVDEHLDSHGRGAYLDRALPAVARRLREEERGTFDRQAHDRAEVPQLRRAHRTLVPVDRC